jgi:formylglycine-generating enzyme required for sulfatase activity
VEATLTLSLAQSRRQRLLAAYLDQFAFIQVPDGTFNMGREESSHGTPDERPAHSVHVSEFWIGTYQVTNGVYYSEFPFAVDRREVRSDRDRQPVTWVTWFEAAVFAKWLGCDLPTEAEWEYACRAGGRDDSELFDYDKIPEYAWYVANSGNSTQEVGQKRGNSLGVYDMLGNVREWCHDWFDAKYYEQCHEQGTVSDPKGPDTGTRKCLRGGCFDWNVANLVPSYRNYNPPENSYFVNGFRLVFRGATPR